MTTNAMKVEREIFLAAGMSDYVSKLVENTKPRTALARWAPGGNGVAAAATYDPATRRSQASGQQGVIGPAVEREEPRSIDATK